MVFFLKSARFFYNNYQSYNIIIDYLQQTVMRQTTFTQTNFRYKKAQRNQERSKLFNKHRKLHDMQVEINKEQHKNQKIQDLDYHAFYSPQQILAINHSLQCPIPQQLPQLDIHTISLYRRAGRLVYQTRRPGSKDLDPHMTYESLLILAFLMNQGQFGKYSAVVKQFQRQFKSYLTMRSRDVSEMAVNAAGNKILLEDQDVIDVVRFFGQNALWVMINHVYQEKLSSRYLLPYLITKKERVFQVFFELSNNIRDESIIILTESDQAIDALIDVLEDSGNIVLYSLRIISNILGQNNQDYFKLFQNTRLLQHCEQLLIQGNKEIKEAITFMLVHYAFQPSAATRLLQQPNLCYLLVQLLKSNPGTPIKVNILDLFSFVVYKAQRVKAFRQFAQKQLLEICQSMLEDMQQEVVNSSLQLVCGLLELGQQFPDEDGVNVVAVIIESNFSLLNKIKELSECEYQKTYGLCYSILDLLSSSTAKNC